MGYYSALKRNEIGLFVGMWMDSESVKQWCKSGKEKQTLYINAYKWNLEKWYSSIHFSHSVMSNSLWPIDRSTPGLPVHQQLPVYPDSCPLSPWCHPTISSSLVPFSSCLQSFPAWGSFLMSQLFTLGSQSIGVSASTSVLPMNTQDCSPLGWTGLISLLSKGLKGLLQHHSSKASILRCSAFFIVQLSHPYVNTGKTIALTRQTFVDKVMSLFFNMLSRLVITFLPKSMCLLISWLQSPSAQILEPPKVKSTPVTTVSPSICHEVMDRMP